MNKLNLDDVYNDKDVILDPDEKNIGGLYLGGIKAVNIKKLEKKQIFAILTVMKDSNLKFDESQFVLILRLI
jgi:hypothetical protein